MASSLLLADSGSSKSDWVLLTDGNPIVRFQSVGLNPYFLTAERITDEIRRSLPIGFDITLPDEVRFYGSGCSAPERIIEVEDAVRGVFPYAQVMVDSDLVGASRALFGNQAGMVAILGTGSNVCLYNGHQIVSGIQSLGYLFGDWGSGAVIGKELVAGWLRNEMPENLAVAFENWHGLSVEAILKGIYRDERPSRFLASFVPFLSEHTDHDWVVGLLNRNFDDFFRFMVGQLPQPSQHSFGAVGSVAFYFQDFVRRAAEKVGIQLSTVLAAPIDGLVLNHGSLKCQ